MITALIAAAVATSPPAAPVADAPVSDARPALWVVNDEIEAPLLVGAGGHFCPVAQHLGAVLADETIVAAQEV